MKLKDKIKSVSFWCEVLALAVALSVFILTFLLAITLEVIR